jgi:hypothetical protein
LRLLAPPWACCPTSASGSLRRVTSSPSSAARCAMPSSGAPRPTSTSRPSASPEETERSGRGARRALGDRPRLRHHRDGAQGRYSRSRSRPTAPTPTTGSPASRSSRSATTWPTTSVRRDFTVNAMALRLPSLEFVDRMAVWPTSPPPAAHTGHRRGVLRRRPAADDAGGAVRRAARVGAVAPRCMPRCVSSRHRRSPWSRRSGCATSSPSCCWPGPRGRAALLVDTGLADHIPPGAARAAAGDRRAPPAQGRLRALADRP